jgi:transcriptional regulator with XRE-family HTH domain
MTTLGTKLRKFRTVAKLSQQEIADKLNIRQATYSNWEKGTTNPSLEHIIKLSEVLNVPIQEFLSNNIYIQSQDNKDNSTNSLYIGINENTLKQVLEPIYLLIQQNKELIELLKNKK